MPKVNYPFAINVDWLEVFGRFTVSFEHCSTWRTPTFSYQDLDFPTKQYLRAVRVYYYDGAAKVEFALLRYMPRMSVVHPCQFHLKIENRFLYTPDWYRLYSVLCSELKLSDISISRLDLAYDCNRFKNGRKPHSLLSDFLSRKLLKIGVSRCVANFASMGYQIANGTSSVSAAKTKISDKVINAITWGSRTGGIQHQIYDKSREMREVKLKPWIVREWERCGLDITCVWRCEIRIQKRGKELLLLDSYDLYSLSVDDVKNSSMLLDIFTCYAEKCFNFVISECKARKDRMTKVELFCTNVVSSVRTHIHRKDIAGGRTLRVVRNFVSSFEDAAANGMYPYLSADQIDALRSANRVLAGLTPIRYMEDRKLYSSKFWDAEMDDWRRNNRDLPLYAEGFIESKK